MALDVSTSAHNTAHLLSNLPASCCALGYTHKGKYHIGEYCKEAIRELIRYLRRDDDVHSARRYLGKSKVLVLDLLPIVKHYHEDDELFDLVLRLLVNLTNPVLLLYNEELPSDPSGRRCYLQIISQLQVYKEAFADESLWAVLANKLTSILKIDSAERTEEVGMIAERILVLARNVLQVPADPAEQRPDSDANIHDQVIWALNHSGLTDLIMYISSVENEQAYCMHVLEIICLMLREQSAAELAHSQAERSLAEQAKDVEELMSSIESEKATKLNKMKNSYNTRHPRFGGSFVVRNVKSISECDVIVHKPYSDTEKVPHDIKKEKAKVRKNEMALRDDDSSRRSPLGIRLFLQKFCNEFLSGSYNTLMRYVKGCLMRRIAQPNDESFYLWAMKFFMEFNREAKHEIKLVSETINVSTFFWVINQMEHCHGMLKAEKKKLLFWSRRTHLALRAYLELIRTLMSMETSSDKTIKESARVLQGNLFYVVEHREALLWLLNSFDEIKMSREYLQDMMLTLHFFTKLLERFCKSQRGIVVQSKRAKKRKKKSKKSTPAPSKPAAETAASNEELWNEVAPQVSVVLASGVIPEDIVPFDAASDEPIEDQKVDAMRRIHTMLKHHKYEEAVGMLRASREVWQDNDIFGRANINPEEELMTLREIFFADIAQDPEVAANAEENREEEEEEDEEETDEENEEEEGVPVYNEREFDFNDFLKRLVSSHAIQPACLLLKTFETNSTLINHCVAKLLHRVAWEAKSYAVLFQASLFIQFRKILASPRPEHKELAQLAKFVFRKFVEVAQKNKVAFVELLPWKSAKQAYDIEEGYEGIDKESKASKKAWKEEEEDELRRLHAEFERDEPGGDMVDWILERLINRSRTRNGVRKKLRELFLVLPSGQSKPPKDWSEAEICELTQLYGRYKDSSDPLENILTGLTVKRGKKKVIDKLLDLGLVSDRKQLHKRNRSNVRRGGNNSSSDDSDADPGARRQKKKQKQKVEQKDRAALKKAQRKGPASKGQVVSTLLQVLQADLRGGLLWLLDSLKDAADDLEAEPADGTEGIPLLAVQEDAVAAMDNPLFHRLLQNLGMSPPFDEQEIYWRIPEDLSPGVIREKVALLQSALDGTLTEDDAEDNVQSANGGDSSDEDSQAAGTSQKQKKTKGRRPRLSDSSSEEDLMLPSERRPNPGAASTPLPKPKKPQKSVGPRPHLSDSDSDGDVTISTIRNQSLDDSAEPGSQTSQKKQKAKDKRRRLSDSSSDDDVTLSSIRNRTLENSVEPDSQTSQKKQKAKDKRRRLSDSSSDDDITLSSIRNQTLEDSVEPDSQTSQKKQKAKDKRRRLSDSSSDDDVTLSSIRKHTLEDSYDVGSPLGQSTQKKTPAKNTSVRSARGKDKSSEPKPGKNSKKKKETQKSIGGRDESEVGLSNKKKKRIDRSLLESDSEDERGSSRLESVGDENDINTGNRSVTKPARVLDSESEEEQRTQSQPKKKKKAVLSDSDEDMPTQKSSEDAFEKRSGKRVLSSSDEEVGTVKKRAVELED